MYSLFTLRMYMTQIINGTLKEIKIYSTNKKGE